MPKSSTATIPKNPPLLLAKSAWARGPPQTATAPTPRSQSPAPSASAPTYQTHSRRPSTLGQVVPVKDSVGVPKSNVGAVKQGSAVTFGSIDDISAPISSSPAAAPPTKLEGVNTFGSVPVASSTKHVNGKASISSRISVISLAASSSSLSSTAAASTSPTSTVTLPQAKPKIDIKKMFSNPSSAPSSTSWSDKLPPPMRNLHSQQSASYQGQSTHAPPFQLAHSFTPFVPSQMRPPQNSGPNRGPPRSPQYPRAMPNGNGPPSQGGQSGGPPAGLSSPRLEPRPHNGQPPPMAPPQMQPQIQHIGMPWAGCYQPYPPDPQQYMYQQWYQLPMAMHPSHAQHQHPPPNQHIPLHAGMPMSPTSALQGPRTPTLSHAMPTPVHAQHPPPPPLSSVSDSINGLTSPSQAPSVSIPRLNVGSSASIARTKVTLMKEDGAEVHLENIAKTTPAPVTTSTVPSSPQAPYRYRNPSTPNRRPASICIESEDQHKLRLAEEQKENEKAKWKADAEEKVRKVKAEAERKVKEAEGKKRQEDAEKEHIWLEEETKEGRLRGKAEQKVRKEAERKVRKEEETPTEEIEWYQRPSMNMHPTQAQHQHQPPNKRSLPHTSMSMSSRNPPSTMASSSESFPSEYGGLSTRNRRPPSIRIESENQRKMRLAGQERKEIQKTKLIAEVEKLRTEEDAEHKVKEAEEQKTLEAKAIEAHSEKICYGDGSDYLGSTGESSRIQERITKVAEDSAEFFAVRDFEKGDGYFVALPISQHHWLIENLLARAVGSNEADARLVTDFFAHIIGTNGCSAAAFTAASTRIAETTDDPAAIRMFATIVKAANLNGAQRSQIASHVQDRHNRNTFLGLTHSVAPRQQESDLEVVSSFLNRSVRTAMRSTAVLEKKREELLASIVEDIATHAPETLTKLALIIKGEGLVA